MYKKFSDRLKQLPVNEEQRARMDNMRNNFIDLSNWIEEVCPAGRTRQCALTKLEEACMFAIKAASGHQ